ncbi:MAG: SH3 domain-containing protein [Anaerolineales bacterium]|nr:SH3 domain-containing protein [Anaerolineales bacterium]
MNFWKQLPGATRIYLVIIVYLALVLCGLVLFREAKKSWNGPGKLVAQVEKTTGTPGIDGTPAELEATRTIRPGAVWLRARTNVRVYDGPGEAYPGIAWLEDNQTAEVVGTNEERTWWVIELPYFSSGRGWVQGEQVEVSDGANVPVVDNNITAGSPGASTGTGATAKAIANINIRSGPDLKYQKIGTLKIEQTAEILGVSGDRFWYLIRVPDTDNVQGWVSRDYVLAQNADSIPVVGEDSSFQATIAPGAPYAIALATLNVRAGPNVTFAVIGQLQQGTMAEIVGKTADGIWLAIRFPGAANERAWVAAAWVKAENVGNVPVLK